MERQIDAIILLLQEICNHLKKSCAGITITIGNIENSSNSSLVIGNCGSEILIENVHK